MRDPDFFYGTPGNDDLFPAPWKVNARAGNDFVGVDERSPPSPDLTIILFGKLGDDRLSVLNVSNSVNESVYGGLGDDAVSITRGLGLGQAGDDIVSLSRNFDVDSNGTIRGGEGNDNLSIGLRAGSGAAIARGGDGDDRLNFFVEKGAGHARLIGGDGADTFGSQGTTGRGTVADFDFAEGDRLDIPDRGRIKGGVQQEVGGTPDDPFLLISYSFRVSGSIELFSTSLKLLGVDAPLSDAAFI